MSNLLDISIHGPQRVEIVEQLVHICRYTPGIVLLEGDAGKSPINFLRHMANLLRDELDFALIDTEHCNLTSIAAELVTQWFVYQSGEHEQTDIQSIHHYLDLGLQSGRLALIVIERSSLLTDEAVNFLVGMMARHSRLTILFAGIIDTRPLLRRAQQAEIPVHRIDVHDSAVPSAVNVPQPEFLKTNTHLSSSGFDHTFSDDSYELPEEDVFEEDFYEPGALEVERGGRREPVMSEQYAAAQSSMRINASDSMLGVSTRLSAVQAWGSATLAGIRKNKQGGGLLLLGCFVLVVLLLLLVRNSRDVAAPSVEQSVAEPAQIAMPSPATQLPALLPAVGSGVKGEGNSGAVDLDAQVSTPPAPSPAEIPAIPLQQPALQERVAVGPAQVPPIPKQATREPVERRVKSSAKALPVTEKYWRAKPDNFTVQIAAAHGEANIRRLEEKLPTAQPHYVYRTTRDGKPWFILIYGSFGSKKAASSARDSLAASIRKDSAPWVRKQGEVFAQ